MKTIIIRLFVSILLLTCCASTLYAKNASKSTSTALHSFYQLKNAGLLLQDGQGQTVLAEHANTPYVPASTTKLVTAWLALQHWGESYRFKTPFYWQPETKTLFVKGSGDPFLVSEEIAVIAQRLYQRGIRQVDTIVLDTSLFQPDLVMPGTGRTNNPYDAVPSALAANFNTVNIKKINGKVVSAEPQTPLTPIAKRMGKRFRKGTLRVNIGRDPRVAEKYFAEVLIALLRQQGIKVNTHILGGRAPQQKPFYVHTNSKTLGEVVRPMLKYSTNFIANQLILTLSAEHYGRPANAQDVQHYMQNTLAHYFNWPHITLKDGAGLSRANRLSPRQLVQLLDVFRRWKHLLPEIEPGIYAKSGTLNKVSTLAGYIEKNGQLKTFALMMNQGVPYKLRNRVARELSRY